MLPQIQVVKEGRNYFLLRNDKDIHLEHSLQKSIRELQGKGINEQFTGFLLLYNKSQKANK